MSLGIYGVEEVELERTNLDTTHAELNCVWAVPAAGPEAVVIQCQVRGGPQPQSWTLSALTLSRLQ